MNYANLFSRAWALIWRNKFLLALGFLAALSGDALSQVRIGPELSLLGGGGLLRANVLDTTAGRVRCDFSAVIWSLLRSSQSSPA